MSVVGPTLFTVGFWALIAAVLVVFVYEVYVLGREFDVA